MNSAANITLIEAAFWLILMGVASARLGWLAAKKHYYPRGLHDGAARQRESRWFNPQHDL